MLQRSLLDVTAGIVCNEIVHARINEPLTATTTLNISDALAAQLHLAPF